MEEEVWGRVWGVEYTCDVEDLKIKVFLCFQGIVSVKGYNVKIFNLGK